MVPSRQWVPQGLVLGPSLFILYVNDIPDLMDSKIKMFADDIKIYAHLEMHSIFRMIGIIFVVGRKNGYCALIPVSVNICNMEMLQLMNTIWMKKDQDLSLLLYHLKRI